MAKRGSALTKKLDLSEELADFMGYDRESRAEVTKAVWDHIKSMGLQDPNDGRIIRPDKALQPLLGKKPINMMKMTGLLSKHFIKDEE